MSRAARAGVPPRPRSCRWSLAAAAAAAIVALSGCAAGAEAPAKEFSGAWADEFATAFDETNSEFVRAVLADGAISDQEFAEMRDRYSTCLAEVDIEFSSFAPDGSSEISFPPSMSSEAAHEKMGECSRSSGEYPIGALFAWMQRNPDHRDEDTIMAECLVRERAVAPGYGATEYAADTPSGTWPFPDEARGREALETCAADPLGLFDGP